MEQQQQQEEELAAGVVPPGFRFHPTEEELVGYYLARKVASPHRIDLDIIQEVDLYRIEPWDLLQERCSGPDEQMTTAAECYFFSYKDRKYPSGTRTNRATAAGFWKATGRDKPVLSSSSSSRSSSNSSSRVVIGMRKTLVFYKGRAPNGSKTDWIMHEYRLVQSNHHHATIPQEEGWVVCRAFHKPIPNQQRPAAGYYYHDHLPNTRLFMGGYGSSSSAADLHQHRPLVGPPPAVALNTPPQVNDDEHRLSESKKQQQQQQEHRHLCFSLPQLVESPSIACAQQTTTASASASASAGAIDWNFLDTLLSQLHEPSAAFLQ